MLPPRKTTDNANPIKAAGKGQIKKDFGETFPVPIRPKKIFFCGRFAAISFFPLAQDLAFGGSFLTLVSFGESIFGQRFLKNPPFSPMIAP